MRRLLASSHVRNLRVPLLCSLALAACQLVTARGTSPGRAGGPGGTGAALTYWGPECERIEAPKPGWLRGEAAELSRGKQPNVAHDPADQILRLVCVDTIMSDEDEPARNTWVIQHFRFDELLFDDFTASEMLVQCLLAGSCLDAPHVTRVVPQYSDPENTRRAEELLAQPPAVWQYYEAGMMRWYAERVDPAVVQKRLAALPLSADAQRVYLQLLERARAEVGTFTARLTGDAKRIFVDVPLEIFHRRQGEYQLNAPYVTELATLAERVKLERKTGIAGVTDATLADLAKLRIAYAHTCHGDCTGGTIFAAITTQLFWSYVSRDDAPAATAEAKLLAKLDPTAAMEIATAQTKLVNEALARRSRVERAREQGIDSDAAASTANGTITDLGRGNYVYDWNSDFKIYWESLLPTGQVGPIEGRVAGLDARGDQVTVRFLDEVSSYAESTGCHETGRVESISSDGHITYRTQCTGSKTKTERRKVEPVTMRASEAAGLVRGDEVIGFHAFGPNQERIRGRVWVVRRGSKLVRLRDVPL